MYGVKVEREMQPSWSFTLVTEMRQSHRNYDAKISCEVKHEPRSSRFIRGKGISKQERTTFDWVREIGRVFRKG